MSNHSLPQEQSPIEASFEDFTEEKYQQLIRATKAYYSFEPYGSRCKSPHVLWRHDMDYSPMRSLRLAQIEAQEGVQTTYCVLLHTNFYNILEPQSTGMVKEILSLGHHLGLHFDVGYYDNLRDIEALEKWLAFEKDLLEQVFQVPINVFSYHNPDVYPERCTDRDMLAGMINTYGQNLKQNYGYCSDSNGYWRHQRLFNVIASRTYDKLQTLTHPAWWTPEVMSPRDRITRCIDGRARAVHEKYDQDLMEFGRINVGKITK